MRISNCLLFALGRRIRYGGHFIAVKSEFGWWDHYIWSADLITFEEYVPLTERRKRRFPPALFRGQVRIWRPAYEGWRG